MCNTCQYKKICKYKHSVELFIMEIEQTREDYSLPNLEVGLICKEFKEEEC
ncbi:MAG: hypothetical protein AWM53_02021 [Candidatus Dichloromethanomonas elyunquensis]|nr:MAG: hypothetical protein AWM53_02021 [Candidatus Dichloromethanomonas elyunquensis]